MRSWDFRKLVAVALVLTTIFLTMPVSAADFSKPKPVLGSISAVGSVELRGFAIHQEGTLFAGDRIRAHEKAYAKILLGNGSKIELAEKTDVSINPDAQGMKIAMNAGTVGFTASAPLRISILPFEVVAADSASGNVAIMSATSAGVRAIKGSVTVRNLKTSESFVLTKGQERLFGLKDGSNNASIAELASNVPMPIPAPQAPAGRTGGRGLSMDAPAWIAVIAGAAVGVLAVTGLVIAINNRDDIKDIKAQNTALSGQIDALGRTVTANQAATQAALAAISNAASLSANAAQVQSSGATAAVVAAQTEAALRASGNAALAAQAAGFAAEANAASVTAASLQQQIQDVQAAIARQGSATAAQLAALTNLQGQLTTARNRLNAAITSLNSLLLNPIVQQTPGVPRTTITTVPPPVIGSASVPV